MATLNRWWRIAVVAACIAGMGAGGFLYAAVLFPALRLLPGGRKAHARRVRAVIHRSFNMLITVLQVGGVMRLERRNIELLGSTTGPVVVIANHPSYLDIVVLIAHIPQALCVVKSKLWSNPFFGGVVRAAGYVRNDEPDRLVENCASCLAEGAPLIIFPEGTRSTPGEPLRFVRGAAHVALKSSAVIQPVVLRCEPPTFTRTGKWYDLPAYGFSLVIDVRPRLGAAALLDSERAADFKPRALTRALERFFTTQLNNPHPIP